MCGYFSKLDSKEKRKDRTAKTRNLGKYSRKGRMGGTKHAVRFPPKKNRKDTCHDGRYSKVKNRDMTNGRNWKELTGKTRLLE
jgi:hypothetical protein